MPTFDEQYLCKILPIYILMKKKNMNLYFYYAYMVG